MTVLIIGAGICGLGTALLLARDGHDVTVLEADDDPLPESPQAAWTQWARKGVAQFRQPHNFMPGLRLLLEAELPDVQDALRSAGASRYDLLNPLPPVFTDRSPRPIDDKLWTYTARRPAAEWVFANVVNAESKVTVRRGVRVTGLVSGPEVMTGTPHVVGVADDGSRKPACRPGDRCDRATIAQFHAGFVSLARGRRTKSRPTVASSTTRAISLARSRRGWHPG